MAQHLVVHRVDQNAQLLGHEDQYLVARAHFTLVIDGQRFPDLYADLDQRPGLPFEASRIEVGPPVGYNGPLDFDAYRADIEAVYRRLVGSQGRAIRIEGCTDVTMEGNTFILE